MSAQPEALLLADELDGLPANDFYEALGDESAAELRRLHAENERLITQRDALLEALKAMLEQFNFHTITGIVHDESEAIVKARSAIKAVEGEKP